MLKEEFGLDVPNKLTEGEQEKIDGIQQLFTEMWQEYRQETLAVFLAAAQALHGAFLKDVLQCPEFVIAYCQQKLSPQEVGKRRALERALRQAGIASAKRTLQKLAAAAD